MDTVSEIKNKVKISDIISKRLKLSSNGANRFKACCPFHNEKTPSFHLDDVRGIYKCFGCGESGDMFNFIQKFDNLKDFSKTLEVVADIAGVEVTKVVKDEKVELEKKKAQDINQFACGVFQKDLQGDEVAQKYLIKRGISKAKIEDFCFGFARDSYNFLTSECEKNGFKLDDILGSGFAKKSDNNSVYTIFRNRIIIPIFDVLGKCIGFGGRAMSDDVLPKYINSFESKVFKKGKMLYNLNRAIKKKSDFVVVCEGYMDAISLDIAGFAAVAPLGTSITLDQILLVKKYFKKVVFWMDSDEAGRVSQLKSANLTLGVVDETFTACFVLQKDGKDPDDYVRKMGKTATLDLINNGALLHDFLWQNLSKNIDFKNPNDNAKLQTGITNTLNLLVNESLKKEYSFFFKNKIYLSKYQKTFEVKEETKKPEIKAENLSKKDKLQVFMMKILSQKKELLEHVEFDFELDEKFGEVFANILENNEDLSDIFDIYGINFSIICDDERAGNQFARFCIEYKAILLEEEVKKAISGGGDLRRIKILNEERKKILEKLKMYNI